MPTFTGGWPTPPAPGEICAYCLTGHGPNWLEPAHPEPEYRGPKWLRRFLHRWWSWTYPDN